MGGINLEKPTPAIIFGDLDKSKGWMERLVDWLGTKRGQDEVSGMNSRDLMDPRKINPVATMAASIATFYSQMLGGSGKNEKPIVQDIEVERKKGFAGKRVLDEQSAN
jgi:hypothetical protein